MTSNEKTITDNILNLRDCEAITEGRNTIVVRRRDGQPLSNQTLDELVDQLSRASINVEGWKFQ